MLHWLPFASAAVMATLSGNIPGDNWKVLTRTSHSTVYVDVTSAKTAKREYDGKVIFQIWVKTDYSAKPRGEIYATVQLSRVLCNDDAMFNRSFTTYGADGSVLATQSYEDTGLGYEPMPPGTIGKAIVDFSCGRRAIDEANR